MVVGVLFLLGLLVGLLDLLVSPVLGFWRSVLMAFSVHQHVGIGMPGASTMVSGRSRGPCEHEKGNLVIQI